MTSLKDLAKNLRGESLVAIICHIRPDGDALGSAVALKNALSEIGVTAHAFCDDTVPEKFDFIIRSEDILNTPLKENYSALIAVDCADVSRLGEYANDFLSHKNTFNIDHHLSNNSYAKYNYVIENPSNALNIFDIIKELGAPISVKTANLLQMGIMTDTGNFTHQDVGSRAHIVTAELIEKGANLNEIYFNTFKRQTKARAKVFGIVMGKLRYFHNDRLCIATVFEKDMADAGMHPSETEGFVDFIMGIDGVEVGACVMEMGKDKYKISLRSKGVNVNAVASSFGGGGHFLASGCQINSEYEDVIDKLSFAVSRELID
ncbi:MAG: bifunctional oligoribonuclease/PAP phosphatase NrnA [Clostridia bacterium]|nr:bifunctional oligoribonuclease/PAP phosphatase NrnA [Clostridia bacterium]